MKYGLDAYDYVLPERRIAQTPARPRDAAKLLVYDRKKKTSTVDTFRNLDAYLKKGAVLVLNDTKVIPARFKVIKESGGKATLLYIGTHHGLLEVWSDRALRVSGELFLGPHTFTIVAQKEKSFFLQPSFPARNVIRILERYGTTPIPPYITHSPLGERSLRKEYQSIFAKKHGSIAAPTASLHFTNRLLTKLKREGIRIVYVTLHVNLGTFAPISKSQIANGKLHEEYFEISKKTAQAIQEAKRDGRPIIAVGTTVARTLESATDSRGRFRKLGGVTDLFIRPGYQFKIVDGLITNFHVPRSSLLMLVAAFTGRKKLLELYQSAIKKKFRFFSFGDAMMVK